MALVFQYGSNTDAARLNGRERLNGRAVDRGAAQTVEAYRLAFDVWSTGSKCAAADLVRTGNRPGWGVLFEVPDELLSKATSGSGRSFDEIEGERMNYRRSWLPVRDRNGQLLIALTYVVVCPRENLRTSEAYVGHILKGLRDHDVPQNYIDDVKGNRDCE
jgi:cation transport regulator ChaC